MSDNFEQKVADAIANPRNVGELSGADSVGTVGSPGCGDMMRMWIKFKEGVDSKIPPEAQANLSAEMKAGIVRNLGLAEARAIITGAAPCPARTAGQGTTLP